MSVINTIGWAVRTEMAAEMGGGRRGKGGDCGGGIWGRSLTEDGVLLGVLVAGVRANERAEVVILHGVLIPGVKRGCQRDLFKRSRG